MNTTPIDALLETVEWTPRDPAEPVPNDGTIYSTHEGVLEIFGAKIRCARLSTGEAVFIAEDIEAFFAGLDGKPKYPVMIYWSDEDSAFLATAIGLKNCTADGETMQEALTNLELMVADFRDSFPLS